MHFLFESSSAGRQHPAGCRSRSAGRALLCYADILVRLWVPSSPSSARLSTHVSHVLKAMCILGSGSENRGELAHVVIGSWSGTDFRTYCVLTESVQDGADVEKEVDDQEEDSSLPDKNEEV